MFSAWGVATTAPALHDHDNNDKFHLDCKSDNDQASDKHTLFLTCIGSKMIFIQHFSLTTHHKNT